MPTFSTLFLLGCGLGVLDLFEDRVGGPGGVVGSGNGAAGDQHGGSLRDGLGWGGDALLISDGAASGADSGDDEEGVGAGFIVQGGDRFGGADQRADSAGWGECG